MKSPIRPFATVAILCTFIACKKNQDKPNDPVNPNSGTPNFKITAIAPTHGAAGASIRISGAGFGSNAANDSVKINGMLAAITAASDTALTVTIPVRAGTGAVTLTTGGKTVTGPVLTYDSSWIVSTIAGSSKGFLDAKDTNAKFFQPHGVCVDNNGNIYVADAGNLRIRMINTSGMVSTLAGGTYGTANGIGTAAQFTGPTSVARDNNGFLYITDSYGNMVKKYDPTTGVVTTLAGTTGGRNDGPVASAQLLEPNGIWVTPDGQYAYFADMGNNKIRMVGNGMVNTLAGNTCYSGHSDGYNREATFQSPFGVCSDNKGNFFVADYLSMAIRKISTTTWLVTTIAGDTMTQGSKDGIGRAAQFFSPTSICIAPNGTLYVADAYNHEIRQVTQDGVVTTIAGAANSPGTTDGPGSIARFNTPWGVNIDSQGALYIADTYNHRIRKMVRG